ncbi:protein-glutamate methylesterase/protein-glutamine glutaminase [Sphingomonas montanisoli]|uniref:Protein-glutamate methylesterase/protein-glutamine glutaminase n=1 Tax=Sphingomonas montanisoli TaxID=2606412 RepID=A0A5D9C594_9SPHN|nr:chemotaxis response regulator protein-glutamate methylesterase [Sphingomonas montanisoli]TZG26200.1 chemotaxis response regulator protein-glutamate methylesterase [Sphingomonas montanisoli]
MSVRCLIVDDSPTMRALLTGLLTRDREIEVIGTAEDAHKARAMIRELDPDVITLDIEMPHMNGLDFLDRLMRLRPTPVVMCSTLTTKGAEATVRALELGAVDCFAKPEGRLQDVLALDDGKLAEMVKQAARSRRRLGLGRSLRPAERPATFEGDDRVVAIGASTGGVEALTTLLSGFPANCPPTVIVQHMPGSFTKSFAGRLDSQCAPKVLEATDDAPLLKGHVYIAPGGNRHLMVRGGSSPHCRLVEASPVSGHRPSVDVLFRSVAQNMGDKAVGVLLTGMGRDGASGLAEMREAGCRTIGQNEASCVVYGMPRAAQQIGAVEEEQPIQQIANRILALCSR